MKGVLHRGLGQAALSVSTLRSRPHQLQEAFQVEVTPLGGGDTTEEDDSRFYSLLLHTA